MIEGVIKTYRQQRGYGFILPYGVQQEYFFREDSIICEALELRKGMEIQFSIKLLTREDERFGYRPEAYNILPLSANIQTSMSIYNRHYSNSIRKVQLFSYRGKLYYPPAFTDQPNFVALGDYEIRLANIKEYALVSMDSTVCLNTHSNFQFPYLRIRTHQQKIYDFFTSPWFSASKKCQELDSYFKNN